MKIPDSEVVAFDYDAQKWLKGTPQAKALRLAQVSGLLALLRSPSGLHYCQFAGIANQTELIQALEIEKTNLQ